ncbi:MAG: Acetyltransferases, including N-acetylases of ribosomal proteins [uncultured Nocardioides sp.]|uniref:Acetyltransferases, including N-acetylases of ribosomal proteins n=1 Tax=uncultured Nocardioides sp. TaxID=198441 RepID=A0A6J4ND07_9ACTN|nr:MAG: Acetyltransferases, including N-acetylases of ribosomal proteins [uncultured Nocardioides sp.]
MARVTDLASLFPPFGLHVRAGSLELRPLTDDLLVGLGALAERGIHEPDEMPFYFPWSTAPRGELARNTAQYHWRVRSSFGPEAWDLQLGVLVDGELVGCQGLTTHDFLVTRTGETGSWLGQEFQGRGIGTRMRRAICALAFDHLGFAEVTSGAFLDNPASLAVSRKVGYRADGVRRLKRREGELALNQQLVLTPDTFVRDDQPVEVTGAEALRAFIGLDG